MKTITMGEEFKEKYSFRETCFGIVRVNDKLLFVKKNDQYSLVGGGIENGESYLDCLKREFIEESGYEIISIKEMVTIDCYWLAADKYPMLSKVNIFEVNVDLENRSEATEDGCYPEWIDMDNADDLLPLPYHKKALEYYKENQ